MLEIHHSLWKLPSEVEIGDTNNWEFAYQEGHFFACVRRGANLAFDSDLVHRAIGLARWIDTGVDKADPAYGDLQVWGWLCYVGVPQLKELVNRFAAGLDVERNLRLLVRFEQHLRLEHSFSEEDQKEFLELLGLLASLTTSKQEAETPKQTKGKHRSTGPIVSEEDRKNRRLTADRWNEFKENYKQQGYSKASYSNSAKWMIETAEDMGFLTEGISDPSNYEEVGKRIKSLVRAHRETPSPKRDS